MPGISVPHVVTTLCEGIKQSKGDRIEYGLRDYEIHHLYIVDDTIF